MLLIHLDKSKKNVYQQICKQVIKLINDGSLKENENLPSTRKLAELLGVNRTTVYKAYQELWAAGYLESTIGGYSKVRKPTKKITDPQGNSGCLFNWSDSFSDVANTLQSNQQIFVTHDDATINFRSLSPDRNLMPVNEFRSCINHVLKTDGEKVLDYNQPEGYKPLRDFIARNMRIHGIETNTSEILLTNGVQNGLELLIRILANPGDVIFLENPTYTNMIELSQFIGLNVVGIHMDMDGIDLNDLENKLKQYNPRFIYTTPTFHNPTGITTSFSHREKLLKLCAKYNVPIIEDGFEEDMKYFGKAILPMKAIDKHGLVIYLGTFSKVLFPGVRVGWIVAPKEIIEKATRLKYISELSPVCLTHAALLEFCNRGYYELHKKRMHRTYRKRMQIALQACRKYLPSDIVSFTKPDGGYLIWFTLKNSTIPESEVVDKLYNAGVSVTQGSKCFIGTTSNVHFRLSISSCREEEITNGIKLIGEILSENL